MRGEGKDGWTGVIGGMKGWRGVCELIEKAGVGVFALLCKFVDGRASGGSGSRSRRSVGGSRREGGWGEGRAED